MLLSSLYQCFSLNMSVPQCTLLLLCSTVLSLEGQTFGVRLHVIVCKCLDCFLYCHLIHWFNNRVYCVLITPVFICNQQHNTVNFVSLRPAPVLIRPGSSVYSQIHLFTFPGIKERCWCCWALCLIRFVEYPLQSPPPCCFPPDLWRRLFGWHGLSLADK